MLRVTSVTELVELPRWGFKVCAWYPGMLLVILLVADACDSERVRMVAVEKRWLIIIKKKGELISKALLG